MDLIIGRFQLDDTDGWDELMHQRVTEAADWPGWLGVLVCEPHERPGERVVVGRWRSKHDYDAWIEGSAYRASVDAMSHHQSGTPDVQWHRVVFLAEPGDSDIGPRDQPV